MNYLLATIAVLCVLIAWLQYRLSRVEKLAHMNMEQVIRLSNAGINQVKWIAETEAVTKYCLYRLGNFDINTFKEAMDSYDIETLNPQFKAELIELADSFNEWVIANKKENNEKEQKDENKEK